MRRRPATRPRAAVLRPLAEQLTPRHQAITPVQTDATMIELRTAIKTVNFWLENEINSKKAFNDLNQPSSLRKMATLVFNFTVNFIVNLVSNYLLLYCFLPR